MRPSTGARVRKALAAITLSVTITGTAAVAGAPPAAAATCYGSSCVGKNPRTTGCDKDAFTVNSVFASPYRRIDLRHSRICNTRWARYWDEDYHGGTPIRLTATRQISSPYGWYNQRVAYGIIDGYAPDQWTYIGWTDMNMNSGDDRHRACNYDTCTDWHI
ncbi:DUF2690 domain-containing protein [Micromonospora deserti]|uniref:DUF2690 domain-containing protein n=1 Tax=Micromonospora deserti TaxID=2070366 RepID=A0A2W2DJ54_9ACTN|nr:DUF2690 domain-containing protein [Micromonospora deserti]PZF99757.1 hypothetical protein C1I99_10775 [Micromonospora deserti]